MNIYAGSMGPSGPSLGIINDVIKSVGEVRHGCPRLNRRIQGRGEGVTMDYLSCIRKEISRT